MSYRNARGLFYVTGSAAYARSGPHGGLTGISASGNVEPLCAPAICLGPEGAVQFDSVNEKLTFILSNTEELKINFSQKNFISGLNESLRNYGMSGVTHFLLIHMVDLILL